MLYPLHMALLSLRRTPWLTALIVLAFAVGIGSSTTVYTMLRAMSGDPIPDKSAQLFTPQLDIMGSGNRVDGELPGLLSYRDILEFKRRGPATRQAGMYEIGVALTLPGSNEAPVLAAGRATHGDFFAMFAVPFLVGRAWNAAEDEARANVVVLSEAVANQLFHAANPLGRTIQVEQRDYTVIGVTRSWAPTPRFYDVGLRGGYLAYARSPDIFVPLETAANQPIQSDGALNCSKFGVARDYPQFLASDCIWTQYWIELRDAAAVRRYQDFLRGYAAEQQRSGRLDWLPDTRLRDVPDWLAWNRIVPDELRVATLVACGFLLVCLVNAVALMLARAGRTATEYSLRRAVGASRGVLFAQGLWEAGVVGLIGGCAGVGLTFAGLRAMRELMPAEIVGATDPVPTVLLLALVVSAAAAVCAGLYPAWRASRTTGLHLKAS